jgi:hypothetical protein
MKRQVHRYIRGLRDAASIRERIFRTTSVHEMKDALRMLLD